MISSSTSAADDFADIVIEEEGKAFAVGIVNSLEKGGETAEKLSVSATRAEPAILPTSSNGDLLLSLELSSCAARSVGTLFATREWYDTDVLAGTKALQYGVATKAGSNLKKFNFIFW